MNQQEEQELRRQLELANELVQLLTQEVSKWQDKFYALAWEVGHEDEEDEST